MVTPVLAHATAVRAPRTFADLNERDLILTNGQGRIVSPSLTQADIPYMFLVRAMHKSEHLSVLIEVTFNHDDVLAHNCSPYRTSCKMISKVLPDYYLPSCETWYVENRTETEI